MLELIVGKRPEKFEETLKLIATRLSNKQYAIRGTSSLTLQNIDMNVDDIDIIGDSKTALECNNIFKEFLVKPVAYSESNQFKSYFGQFRINEILVEVYGDWQIKNAKGAWGQIYNANNSQIVLLPLGVNATKIETELSMFSDMGRWSALQKIKKQMEY